MIRQSVLLAITSSCLVLGGQGRADFYDGKMLLQDCQGGEMIKRRRRISRAYRSGVRVLATSQR